MRGLAAALGAQPGEQGSEVGIVDPDVVVGELARLGRAVIGEEVGHVGISVAGMVRTHVILRWACREVAVKT